MMKTNNFNRIASVFAFVLGYALHAQVQNNAPLYIGDTGVAYVATGNFYFGNAPALTATSRTGSVYGKLAFASGTTWSGASDSHYIDGYARTLGTSAFTFPIGQSGVYAPAKVTPTSANSIDAAYYRNTPNVIGVTVDPSISALSNIEYWDIRGTSVDAAVSISWRSSSNIATLTSSVLTDLTIAGWDGTSWVIIPSTVDGTSIFGTASSLTDGSITTDSNVNLSTYTYFTLASKVSTCTPLIASSGIIKTWNGTWSPSEPTLADPVIINAAYSGNLACNSLTLNADLTLANGQVVEIINGVTGTGKIIMSTEASVVQRNPSATAPTIQMTKITNPMRRYDYVFLSSPINSTTAYFADLANKNNVAVNGAFGTRVASAFELFRTYDAAGLVAVNATAANTPVGRGFSASVRNMAPYASSTAAGAWFNEKYPIHIKTSGSANNGNVSVTVPSNGWARIGNPYPSAIDGARLLDAVGSNVRKTIYLWTFNTPRQTIANASSYNNADFATWNYSGGVAACTTCQVPTGNIATMQSVLVKAANSNSTTFNLSNCMRITTGNNNFFKNESASLDRFWLNLNGSDDSFSQALIAYSENGTIGFDDGYDSQKMGGVLTSQLTSLIGSTKCAIQTRPLFNATDEVPLQLDQVNNETLTISLGNKEGLFADGSVSIYLFDTLLNVYHDLALGGYTYLPTTTNDTTRFKIVYQASALSNPENDYTNNKVIAFINNETLNIQSSLSMKTVEIFDVTGRKIISLKTNGTSLLSQPFSFPSGIYLAKIGFDNGAVSNQKLINK